MVEKMKGLSFVACYISDCGDFTDLHNIIHVNVFFFCCRTLYTDITDNTSYNHIYIYIHIASYQLGFKHVSCPEDQRLFACACYLLRFACCLAAKFLKFSNGAILFLFF